MYPKYRNLIFILIIAVLNIVWAILSIRLPVVGIVFALPLVFVLPGYTLTEILFQKRVQDVAHRIVLSLGLSLAIDILGGFLLNVFPVGLREIPWAILLGLITILSSLWLARIRQKTFLGSSHLMNGGNLKVFNETPLRLVLIVLSFIGILCSVGYSAVSLAQVPRQGFTQLWMLPGGQSDNKCVMGVGIHSLEAASTTYKLVIIVDSVPVRTWSSIILLPEQRWSQQLPLAPKTGKSSDVEAKLYRAGMQIVYRDVRLKLYDMIKGKGNVERTCTA